MKSKLKLSLIALATILPATAIFSASAHAQNYVEVSHVTTKIKAADERVEGYAITGVNSINQNHFLLGRVSKLDSDLTRVGGGLGYTRRITRETTVFSTLTLEYLDGFERVSDDMASASKFAVATGAGFLTQVSPMLQLGANIEYLDAEGFNSFFTRADMYYRINPVLSAFAQYENQRSYNTVKLGVRYRF